MPRNILSKRIKKENKGPKSAINELSDKAIDGVSNAFDNSAVFTWLSTYPKYSGGDDRGIFKTLFRKISRFFAIVRRLLTKFIEESRGIEATKSMLRVFLDADLISWGLCFLVSGLVTTVGTALAQGQYTALSLEENGGIYYGIALLIIGIILITSRDSVGKSVASGPILRVIFVKLFCVNEDALVANEPQKQYSAFAIFGLLMGACNVYFPFWMPIAVIAAILTTVVIFCQPEIGLLASLALLPFFGTLPLIVLSVITCLAFFVKLIRGKRVIKIGAIEITVIFFTLALVVFGLALSGDIMSSLKTVSMMLLFICIYFCMANSMSSNQWVDNIIGVLVLDGAIVAAIAIYQFATGYALNTDWVDLTVFSNISTRVVGTFGNPNMFADYLILIIPIALAGMIIATGKRRIVPTIAFALMIIALGFTYSRGAWLGMIIALIVFALVYNAKLLKALPFIAVITGLAVAFIPSSFLDRFVSIGNAAEGSTAYRLNIWRGMLGLLGDNWHFGIGMGEQVFSQKYPMYAVGNTVSAPHAHSIYLQIAASLGIIGLVALIAVMINAIRLSLDGFYTMSKRRSGVIMLGLGMGMLALFIHGATDYVWYNNRILLLFWMILGIMVLYSRTYNREWNDSERGE